MPFRKENNFEPENLKMVQQFEALFNHATIGIIITGTDGRIINFNRYAEQQFGYTKEELTGQLVEVLIPRKYHHKHVHYRDSFNAHPEPRAMGAGRDLHGLNKDGKEFPVEVSLSHYSIDGDNYTIAFIVDITVRKEHESVVMDQKAELEQTADKIIKLNSQLEEKVEDRTKMLREILAELEKSKDELSEALENEKELSELKSRFVTMASHEFRTPLSTILSSAYLLQKYIEADGNKKAEKHIQRIKNAVAGMKSILEDFLSLGKLEEGLIQTHLELMPYDAFLDEIQNVIQEMQALLKVGQKIALHHNGEKDVYIDKNFLRNILLNLISNAIKFSPDDAVVDVSFELNDEELIIKVSDKGIGISEEDQEHLFERFFRAKNASNIQGTGLGLHIVSKYLELMQGRIELQSKLNEGTTFIVHIPNNTTIQPPNEKSTDN
ncbi:PAS domain-containing sensor histidine kinase [Aridibaculum aurantiacum]|uniref:PAS domain-containing sensor histidine kinase n=1 Tax=Aridibaculum aurantiacum TaxID=2810307 RepID=UPI001A964724|nr:PAS domain-containing sensor histidine kinase [Aridibaculum aurantiacum]